jgi:hypothetical protein
VFFGGGITSLDNLDWSSDVVRRSDVRINGDKQGNRQFAIGSTLDRR